MNVTIVIDGGICGFQTRVHAASEDMQNVNFKIASACEKVRSAGTDVEKKCPIDAYAELGAGSEGVILATMRETLKGCCAGCVVPSGVFKAMQIAAGVALPKDITLAMTME